MEFLEWLQDRPWAAAINEIEWLYALVLSVHAVGMALVLGVGLMFSLRVLVGFPREMSIMAFDRLMPVAWLGFFSNLVSGVLLFAPQAARISLLLMFQLKLGFIILAGFATWFMFQQVIERETGREKPVTGAARFWAVAVMTFWILAIVSGRMIAYIKVRGL